MPNMEIRQAVPGDAEALALLNAAFNGSGLADAAHIRRSLENNAQEIVVIAYQAGRPAGFCCTQVVRSMCYAAPCAEITELYVEPAFRRRGVARRLLQQAEALCRLRGAEEFKLLTGGDNLPAQALYESLGYEPSGEKHYEKEI